MLSAHSTVTYSSKQWAWSAESKGQSKHWNWIDKNSNFSEFNTVYFTNEVDEQNEEIPYERMKKIDWAMGIRILGCKHRWWVQTVRNALVSTRGFLGRVNTGWFLGENRRMNGPFWQPTLKTNGHAGLDTWKCIDSDRRLANHCLRVSISLHHN